MNNEPPRTHPFGGHSGRRRKSGSSRRPHGGAGIRLVRHALKTRSTPRRSSTATLAHPTRDVLACTLTRPEPQGPGRSSRLRRRETSAPHLKLLTTASSAASPESGAGGAASPPLEVDAVHAAHKVSASGNVKMTRALLMDQRPPRTQPQGTAPRRSGETAGFSRRRRGRPAETRRWALRRRRRRRRRAPRHPATAPSGASPATDASPAALSEEAAIRRGRHRQAVPSPERRLRKVCGT
jgi:hypothetical protein